MRHRLWPVVFLAWCSTVYAHAAEAPHQHQHDSAAMDGMAADQADADSEDPGSAPAPPAPADHAADAYFPEPRMAAARAELMGQDRITYGQVLVERFELRSPFHGKAGIAWEGEASIGTDRDRLVLASQGEGSAKGALSRAELQAKWRHALDPWINAELGVRHDLRPEPSRTYLIMGLEGIAPYWIDTEAQLFVSDKGDLHGRFEAAVDQRITQRLILRPAVELDFAFQDVPELGIRSRVPEWAVGARLRYELQPNLAPYLGLEWRRDAPTPPNDRRRSDDRSAANLVVGLRTWF